MPNQAPPQMQPQAAPMQTPTPAPAPVQASGPVPVVSARERGFTFCTRCGNRVEVAPDWPKNTIFCNQCGEELSI